MLMELWVYLSETSEALDFSRQPVWMEKNLVWGVWEGQLTRNHSISIDSNSLEHLQANGSLYAHIFFVPKKGNPNPSSPSYSAPYFKYVHQLNRYDQSVIKARKNLISGKMDQKWLDKSEYQNRENENEKENLDGDSDTKDMVQILSYWKGNLTINVVQEATTFQKGGVPAVLRQFFTFNDEGTYLPLVYGNDFWLLNEDLVILNSSVSSLSLDMVYDPISFFKWSIYVQMEDSFKNQPEYSYAIKPNNNGEDFKRLLLDNNPYILLLTVVISIVHFGLDLLAFKNDIHFWKNKKSMEGLSVGTLKIDFLCELIILAYLIDNEASWIIMISFVFGVGISLWKLTKAATLCWGHTMIFGIKIVHPELKDKHSYAKSTKQHDLVAMKYLYYLSFPLVGLYAIYSLYYDTHKGWVSWVISTLAGCVYTFGFIMMTPQLFINYKLKSVAHLPWRVFLYKAISTFIDDLFAFLMRMPTMHRLRVFRDDIIFLIYLYQRWIYPVDQGRVEVGAEFQDAYLEDIQQAVEEMNPKPAPTGNQGEKQKED
uniref:Uncharacterized protein n=1 Tax=Arcella intermedia TaxID=1963864 RepID=A0A6B2L0R5_9EUKA